MVDYDIVVVGAGPAGLSFAKSVTGAGLRMALIEKQPLESLANPDFDGRDIALTHLSVKILKEFGVWDRLESDEKFPIREARVLDGNSPYTLDFDRKPDDVEALGYIVSNNAIRRTLFAEVKNLPDVELIADTAVETVSTNTGSATVRLSDGRILSSNLLVAADSRFSETRRAVGIAAEMHDFGRVCVVCRMQHDNAHDGIAYECFHYGRTLAILPLSSHQSSIVVTAPMSQRDELMAMSSEQFSADIQDRFGSRYGHMQLATERYAYPLVGVHAKRFCVTRCVLVGDAAVGMHPVTAHGYNLGLSGADLLAREVRSAQRDGKDIGCLDVLRRYERKHLRNTRPIYHGTNEIVKFFTDDRPPAKLARTVALRLANNFPPIKRVIRNKLTERSNRSSFLPPFL
ncbi:MAG: 5-demethoxyubiquinol-8 5-hydroxylase UbiM [Gammaproteobacteria bacterium]|nr:5-demethoxyubiquinol-8 5-hydroxylase UbiM [Gammaproteobacteria bacterium]